MGGKTKTTTSIDPSVLAKQIEIAERAKTIADQPFAPYGGARIAPFNTDQLASFDVLRGIGSGDVGAGLFHDASASAQSLSAFHPQTVAAQAIQAGRLSDMDLGVYTNRWDDAVVAASNADVERSRELQRVRDAVDATAAGAWGGSRHGVADAETNAEALREAGSRSATLRSQGYTNAQQLGLADLNRALSADQSNQSASLQAALGNQTAGIQGAQVRLGGANLLGTLSGQEYQQAVARAGILRSVGDAEQAQAQRGLDFNWEEFLRQVQDPYTKQALLASAVSAIQAPTTSVVKETPGLYDYTKIAADAAMKKWG